jgi:hypothetical protein
VNSRKLRTYVAAATGGSGASADPVAAFMPANCFVQSMRVTSERDEPSTSIITHHAALCGPPLSTADFVKGVALVDMGTRGEVLQEMERLSRRFMAVLVVVQAVRPLTARVAQTFVAESDGEVSLEQGETVVVRHESVRGWVELVKKNGTRGRAPSSDVERIGNLTGKP